MRALVPPARDNQRAAEFFALKIGASDPHIEWVAVRPDTLREGDITDYRLHDELVSSIFHPDETNMANVAHFMCELTCNDDTWKRWRGCMPVIVNARATPERAPARQMISAGRSRARVRSTHGGGSMTYRPGIITVLAAMRGTSATRDPCAVERVGSALGGTEPFSRPFRATCRWRGQEGRERQGQAACPQTVPRTTRSVRA